LAVQAALWLSIPTLDQTQKNALAGLQVAYQSANASQKAAIDMVVQAACRKWRKMPSKIK
jgi:hypothetical protein